MSECSGHLSPFIFTKNNSHHSCCLVTLLQRYGVSLLHSVDSFWFVMSALGCVHSQMKMSRYISSSFYLMKVGLCTFDIDATLSLIYLQLHTCGHCWRNVSLFCKYVIVISYQKGMEKPEWEVQTGEAQNIKSPFQNVCFRYYDYFFFL